MPGRAALGFLMAGCFVFGGANSAEGQVILDSTLEVVEDLDADEDRYGGYEPVSLTKDGPILLTQIEDWVQPPGQTISQPGPVLGPAQSSPSPSAVPASPPVMSGPVIYDYGPPIPASPPPRRHCPPWRPCGPQNSFGGNWLVMQGFAGADFRGACDFHDQCLLNRCNDRKTCDKQFLAYLDNACNCSQFPILCRIKAREMYLGVRLFGWLY